MLEKNRILAENSRKLKIAGIMPRYISGGNRGIDITPEMIERVPFSSQYKTHSEYVADVNKVMDMSLEDIEIPNDVVEKIRKTKNELGIM